MLVFMLGDRKAFSMVGLAMPSSEEMAVADEAHFGSANSAGALSSTTVNTEITSRMLRTSVGFSLGRECIHFFLVGVSEIFRD